MDKEKEKQLTHHIPLGTLVEVQPFDEDWQDEEYHKFDFIRLYVAEHRFDVDGTPLYALGHNLKNNPNALVFNGFTERDLKIIQIEKK